MAGKRSLHNDGPKGGKLWAERLPKEVLLSHF